MSALTRNGRLRGVGLVAAIVGLGALAWRTSFAQPPGPSPREVVAAFHQDKLFVSVPDAPRDGAEWTVEAIEKKAVVASDTRKMSAGDRIVDRFTLAVPAAKRDAVSLRFKIAGQSAGEMPLRSVLLAKGHETTISAGQDFYAGSQGTIQCSVQAIRSISESLPAAARVSVTLVDPKDKSVRELAKVVTDAKGQATVAFDVPNLPAGPYQLVVTTASALGEETVQQQIRIKADGKILLVADKPIYQPGQTIHLRALALAAYTMRPLANQDLLFEVEDSKGNKVFKKTFKTSDYGVASVDFQLADEVNMGNYFLRAALGDLRAEKTVDVKRYVLPKFKTAVKTDKTFYLPKETVKAEVQSDYLFGKPVAKAKVEVTASTFDVAFREFHKWTGATDEQGHVKFEVKLPDYFVGQPLQKGDAIVKLDVKILDSADHAETSVKSLPVSDQPIKLSLLPEGGKIAPGIETRIFAAATYPDGSPAPNCDVSFWLGKEAKDAPLASARTNASGLVEFKLKTEPKHFRQAGFVTEPREFLGGVQIVGGPKNVVDVTAQAKDERGAKAQVVAELNSHPFGENVLIRLDKAIYSPGDRLTVDVRTSAGLPTAYVDVVRGGQVMLSKWVEVKDGQAKVAIDLPPSVHGSLDVHAYQMLSHGEIIRDSRVVYVQGSSDLKVDVQNVKEEYAPGAEGRLRFVVTDSQGKPTPAALGVVIVDEAVYALQDLQPGLEKVYFTLQQELLKPQVQVKFGAAEAIDNLVLQPALPAPRQQIAEVLFTGVKLPPPARWNVDPAVARRQQVQGLVANAAANVFGYAFTHAAFAYDHNAKAYVFRSNLIEEMAAKGHPKEAFRGPFGETMSLTDYEKLEPNFTAEKLAYAVSVQRMQQMWQQCVALATQDRARYHRNGKWVVDAALLDKASQQMGVPAKDVWGNAFKLDLLAQRKEPYDAVLPHAWYEVRSAGPDGEWGTKDDLGRADTDIGQRFGWLAHVWWMGNESRESKAQLGQGQFRNRNLARLGEFGNNMRFRGDFNGRGGGFAGGMGGPVGGMMPPGAPVPMMERAAGAKFAAPAAMAPAMDLARDAGAVTATSAPGKSDGGGPAPISKIREYFPETMLWQPGLITDAKGVADLAVPFADSITTWRLSASANSANGLLGNATMPLKVFQDFFVDIDLPVALTQNDEVAFPVAVYNYLKTPQTVKLELQQEPWFALIDQGGLTRSLDLKPGEVTSVRFRIKANKIGYQPLLVKAFGSKKSDAVRRLVEVVPDGEKIEKTVSDRLQGKVAQTLAIPANAVPEASKLVVRIYPGVMAQVLEGVEGLIRLPGG